MFGDKNTSWKCEKIFVCDTKCLPKTISPYLSRSFIFSLDRNAIHYIHFTKNQENIPSLVVNGNTRLWNIFLGTMPYFLHKFLKYFDACWTITWHFLWTISGLITYLSYCPILVITFWKYLLSITIMQQYCSDLQYALFVSFLWSVSGALQRDYSFYEIQEKALRLLTNNRTHLFH